MKLPSRVALFFISFLLSTSFALAQEPPNQLLDTFSYSDSALNHGWDSWWYDTFQGTGSTLAYNAYWSGRSVHEDAVAAPGTVVSADVKLGAILNSNGYHSAGVNLTDMASSWSDIAFRETVYVSLVKTTANKLLARVLVGQLGGTNAVVYETPEVTLPAGDPWYSLRVIRLPEADWLYVEVSGAWTTSFSTPSIAGLGSMDRVGMHSFYGNSTFDNFSLKPLAAELQDGFSYTDSPANHGWNSWLFDIFSADGSTLTANTTWTGRAVRTDAFTPDAYTLSTDVQLGAIKNSFGYHGAGLNLTDMGSSWYDIAFRDTTYVALVKTDNDTLYAEVKTGYLSGTTSVVYTSEEVPLPSPNASFNLAVTRHANDDKLYVNITGDWAKSFVTSEIPGLADMDLVGVHSSYGATKFDNFSLTPPAETLRNAELPPAPPNVRNLNFNYVRRGRVRGTRLSLDRRIRAHDCLGTNQNAVCIRTINYEKIASTGQPFTWQNKNLLGVATELADSVLTANSSVPNKSVQQPVICGAFPDTPPGPLWTEGATQNPRRCESQNQPLPNLANDCYDFTLVYVVRDSTGANGNQDELWSAKVTVEVENPKTSSAIVTAVDVDTNSLRKAPIQVDSATFPGNRILEPTVTGDGRLIVVHGSRGGIMYSILDETSADPCDATGWNQFQPISELATDPDATPYALATYPIRETDGEPFLAGDIVRGAYPWVDHDGSNLFFTHASSTTPVYDGYEMFLTDDFVPGPNDLFDSTTLSSDILEVLNDEATRTGLVWFGSWTRGKLLHIDSLLTTFSYSWAFDSLRPANGPPYVYDFPGMVQDEHMRVRLFDDRPEGEPVGSTRIFNINSLENRLNYLDYMRPTSPQDVSWIMSVDYKSDEVSFDDELHFNALIASSMTSTIHQISRNYPENTLGILDDGYSWVLGDNITNGEHVRVEENGWILTPKVQNEATVTSLPWARLEPPTHGNLLGGARIEPGALGGIRGKGIFLDGLDDRLVYDVVSTGAVRDDLPWFIGIWVNPHDLSEPRVLWELQNGLKLNVLSATELQLDGQQGTFSLPPSLAMSDDGWTHIGLRYHLKNGTDGNFEFFVNGYWVDEELIPNGSVGLGAGAITVGAETGGFRGWVDEFKVVQTRPKLEGMCNHGYGTLVGVDAADTDPLLVDYYNRAGDISSVFHGRVSWELSQNGQPTYERYWCEHVDPSLDIAYNPAPDTHCLGRPGRDTDPRCVGNGSHFPEGPLWADLPRPNSSGNTFCKTCHRPDSPVPALSTDALIYNGTLGARDDPRRQPTQPPALLWGNVPADWIHLNLTPDPIIVDDVVLGCSFSPTCE